MSDKIFWRRVGVVALLVFGYFAVQTYNHEPYEAPQYTIPEDNPLYLHSSTLYDWERATKKQRYSFSFLTVAGHFANDNPEETFIYHTTARLTLSINNFVVELETDKEAKKTADKLTLAQIASLFLTQMGY